MVAKEIATQILHGKIIYRKLELDYDFPYFFCSFTFSSCFSISSTDSDSQKLNASVKSKIIAETFENNKYVSRVWFKENTTDLYHSFIEHWYPQKCQEETVYVFDGIRDILSPIRVSKNRKLQTSTYSLFKNLINFSIVVSSNI